MSGSWLARLGAMLLVHQRGVLVALLGVLHAALLAGENSPIGLTLWVVDVGLFLLWQPFVRREQRLAGESVLLLLALLGLGAWFYGWWLLILWALLLAALLGGRVLMLPHRPTRLFYLLAFAYLLVALLVYLVPRIVPGAVPLGTTLGAALDVPFAFAAPLIFGAMLLLPRPESARGAGGAPIDFVSSLFVGLLVAVLVLGALASVLLSGTSYLEGLFFTLLTLAAMLLFIAWAWNPRPGFSGLGVLFSRYLLTLGVPFDNWLQRLMSCASEESDPERFLARLLDELRGISWVHAVAVERDGVPVVAFGAAAGQMLLIEEQPLAVRVHVHHAPGPALLWHLRLLVQLTSEFYVAKTRARELERMSYLRAVHETGARLTHDVKNLLQSIDNLCFLAQSGDPAMDEALRKQLPQLAGRLHQTLGKLQSPVGGDAREEKSSMPAELWWMALRERFPQPWISFAPVAGDPRAPLPLALFDNVADNLLDNVRLKQQLAPDLQARVSLDATARCLTVCDDGVPLPTRLAADVLQVPVDSHNGFGLGLYQSARLAQESGFSLRLASNVPGVVCFVLQPAEQVSGAKRPG